MQAVNFVLNTAGNGLWSNTAKSVQITGLELLVWDDELDEGEVPEYGELRVYFNTDNWDVNKEGLIYTDSQFENELAINLIAMGFDAEAAGNVGYSEQGMQGKNFVSLDAGDKFVRTWVEKSFAFN